MSSALKTGPNFQGALLALALVALLMVILSGFLSYKHALHIVDNSQKVAHCHAVLADLTTIRAQISDAEAFQRGFIIMHVDLMEPYQESLRKIDTQIGKLTALTQGDSNQNPASRELAALIKRQIEFSERLIVARSENRINEALEEIEAGRGNAITSSMNKIIDNMVTVETGRLHSGTDSLNDSSRQMIVTIMFLGVLALCSLMMLLFAANMYLQERKRAGIIATIQYEVARQLADSKEIPETISAIIAVTCKGLNWDAGIFWSIEDGSQEFSCLASWQNETLPAGRLLQDSLKRTFKRGETRIGAVCDASKSIWVSDVTADDMSGRQELALQDGVRTAFYAPVVLEGAPYGTFEFLSLNAQENDVRLVDTFESISSQLGQFIHRKRSEWALQVSEARLNAILGNMAEAVLVADTDGQIILSNAAAERMFGGGLVGQQVEKWFSTCGLHNSTMAPVQQLDELPLFRAMKEESVNEQELFVRNDFQDESVWVSATARPVKDEVGHLLAGLMVLRDVSERKEAEQRVSEFYSMVSHELRTPLTSIRASLGLMQGGVAGDLPDMALELIDIGREECDRLIRLINNILDIRKIESGKFDLVCNEVEVRDLVRSAVDGLKGFAEAHQVTLVCDGEIDDAIICDADRIIQVLTNLISNAIKFSPENETVKVSSEMLNDDTVRFSVTDNGAGIAPEKIKKLFTKFQQLDQSTTRKVGGTGLGLAISKAIVRQHGGQISVASTPGKGSTFFFDLPCDAGETV